VGRGAELGILIRNGDALEISEKLSCIVFDKTGTLTTGKPEITNITSITRDDHEILQLAASVEKNSQHPLAEAFLEKAGRENLTLFECDRFHTIGGKGVSAFVNDSETVIGNRAMFEEKQITIPPDAEKKILDLENQGNTVVLVAQDNELIGLVAIADVLKKTAEKSVAELKKMNMKILMITGDNSRSAGVIGDQAGIDRVIAEVLPQDKSQEVIQLQKAGETVGFIGDGINDAPALAQADVGIAMGGGTDIAIESGDIVLMHDTPVDAVAAIQLSKKVIKRIKQNLFWAFAYNTALIPLAAGVFYPWSGIMFKPELAGLAMAMSSVTVVTLSLMLKNYVPPVKKL
jgi:Cu+-exporting ATPase